jgi:hypothetical protein
LDSQNSPRWYHDERKALAAILGGAFLARLICALTTFVIHKDGARFTLMARLFAEGRWDDGLNVWPRMSPLYPMLILGFGSGTAIAMILGTLTAIPIYFLAREIWDRRTATLAALVVAFLPDSVRYGAEVMSEAPFMFFFFTAMLFVHRAASKGRLVDFAMAGVAGALATLTRPEGIYVLAAAIAWTLLRGIAWRRVGGIAMTAVIFVVLLSPYARWIHEKTGRWDFADSPVVAAVKNKLGLSKTAVVVPGEAAVTAPVEKPSKPMPVEYALTWLKVSGYVFLPFLVVGLAGIKRDWGHAFVLVIGGGYAIPPLLNLIVVTWFSARFLLPSMVWLSPIVALGLLRVHGWINRPRLSIALFAVLLVALVAREARPNGLDRRTLVDAGEWIRANSTERPVLISMDRRVEHYAGGISEIAELRFDELQRQVTRTNAEWVVILPERMPRAEEGYLEKIERAWALAQVIPKSKRGDEVRVYRTR